MMSPYGRATDSSTTDRASTITTPHFPSDSLWYRAIVRSDTAPPGPPSFPSMAWATTRFIALFPPIGAGEKRMPGASRRVRFLPGPDAFSTNPGAFSLGSDASSTSLGTCSTPLGAFSPASDAAITVSAIGFSLFILYGSYFLCIHPCSLKLHAIILLHANFTPR